VTTPLDVLLLEALPGDGAVDAALLRSAGHHVHSCHDPDEPPENRMVHNRLREPADPP